MPSGNSLGSWDGALRDMRHESEPLWNQLMVRLVPGEANHLSLSMRVSNAAVMHLNHLGLPVRGLRRSQQFYWVQLV
jgi:hypothetical protein